MQYKVYKENVSEKIESKDRKKSVRKTLSEYQTDGFQKRDILPIARIDFLSSNGKVCDCKDFYSEAEFLKELKEELYYGVPLTVVLYRDRKGTTISKDFLEELDTLPKGLKEENILQEQKSSARCNER